MEAFRTFSVNMGEVQQDPNLAVFYSRVIKKGGSGFSIKLLVRVYLEHGLNGKDVGVDRFLATLVAEDLERKNLKSHHRSRQANRRWFEDLAGLLAWLRSQDLEASVRAGIVHHPPSPPPSPERNLARALFLFADELEGFTDRLKEDRETRISTCPSSKKKTQSEL